MKFKYFQIKLDNMKNYIHTFLKRKFSFKFFTKGVFNDTKKFVLDVIKKEYNVTQIKQNKNQKFIIVEMKEKKTFLELKNEITKLLQDYKNKTKANIQYEFIKNDDLQIASLITNFNIPDLDYINNVDILNEDIDEEKENTDEITDEEKKIVQNYVSKFFSYLVSHIKNYIFSDYDDYTEKKINDMFLSYSYQFKLKKLIIKIPLKFYRDIVFEFLMKKRIDISNINNIDKNNKALHIEPLIMLNYNNVTCYFQEYMSLCNFCKKYHKIFNNDIKENNFVNMCVNLCSKCGFVETKSNKKTEHKCSESEKEICHVCKFHYNENYNHFYKSQECNHTKIQLKNFITSNRIDCINSYKSKSVEKEIKNFVLNKNEYPDIDSKNNKKHKDETDSDDSNETKVYVEVLYDLENNIDIIEEKNNKSYNSDNTDITNTTDKSYNSNNNDNIEKNKNDNTGSLNKNFKKKKNNKYSDKNENKDNKTLEKENPSNNINVIKKINNTYNYEIELSDIKDIQKGDQVNIKIIINNTIHYFKTTIE